jgi:PhzF family phenazine biosynthesis protein
MTPLKIPVHIVNAFTCGQSGGNPAGVVLNAAALSTDQKLAIARQVGLSETAFLSRSSRATLKIDFFTPTRQIAHCGHATVAAFSLCRMLGLLQEGIHTKESVDGLLTVTLKDGRVFLHQPAAAYLHLPETDARRQAAMDSLGISENFLRPAAPLTVARAGNAFLLVPLRDEEALRALKPGMDAIRALSEELNVIGFYPFVTHASGSEFDASARMFAPRYGITEESATGTAAAPLACYLHDLLKIELPVYRIGQGRHMFSPSPSLLMVEVETSRQCISVARVGGRGAQTGTMDIAL